MPIRRGYGLRLGATPPPRPPQAAPTPAPETRGRVRRGRRLRRSHRRGSAAARRRLELQCRSGPGEPHGEACDDHAGRRHLDGRATRPPPGVLSDWHAPGAAAGRCGDGGWTGRVRLRRPLRVARILRCGQPDLGDGGAHDDAAADSAARCLRDHPRRPALRSRRRPVGQLFGHRPVRPRLGVNNARRRVAHPALRPRDGHDRHDHLRGGRLYRHGLLGSDPGLRRRRLSPRRRSSAGGSQIRRRCGARRPARDRRGPHDGWRERRRAPLRPGDRAHDPHRASAAAAHARLGRSDRLDDVRRRRADRGRRTHQLGVGDRCHRPCPPRVPSRSAAVRRRGGHHTGRTGGGRRMGRTRPGGSGVVAASELVQIRGGRKDGCCAADACDVQGAAAG